MIKLEQKLDYLPAGFETTLTLPIDTRIKSRVKVKLDDDRDAGLFLERGTLLRGGDFLSSLEGVVIKIIAAEETVSTVRCDDTLALAKAAYHLGNRHIPLQIEKNWLRYQHDRVLDEMLEQMNIEVTVEQAPFEPEAGAYQQSHNHRGASED